MEISVEIEVICADCGNPIEVEVLGSGEIQVEVCPYCLDDHTFDALEAQEETLREQSEALQAEAYNKGYAEGYAAAKAERPSEGDGKG